PFGGVPPWEQVRAADFPDAFARALADERAGVQAIAANPASPDFANTIEALQRVGQMRDRVARMFHVMLENMSTPEYRALDLEWQPRLAAADDELRFFPGLFERIDAVYRLRESASLTADQRRLTELTWQD